jgi:hypothetical protein
MDQFSKNYRTFYPKNSHQALKNMDLGSGIRDPVSGKNLFRIPDPGVKKAPDPVSGSATLLSRTLMQIRIQATQGFILKKKYTKLM